MTAKLQPWGCGMDQKPAEAILCTSIRAVALFNQLVRDLQGALPQAEFEEQRRRIGKIMGSISVELIDPAASQCPAIDIESHDGWVAAGRLFEPGWLRPVDTGGR